MFRAGRPTWSVQYKILVNCDTLRLLNSNWGVTNNKTKIKKSCILFLWPRICCGNESCQYFPQSPVKKPILSRNLDLVCTSFFLIHFIVQQHNILPTAFHFPFPLHIFQFSLYDLMNHLSSCQVSFLWMDG